MLQSAFNLISCRVNWVPNIMCDIPFRDEFFKVWYWQWEPFVSVLLGKLAEFWKGLFYFVLVIAYINIFSSSTVLWMCCGWCLKLICAQCSFFFSFLLCNGLLCATGRWISIWICFIDGQYSVLSLLYCEHLFCVHHLQSLTVTSLSFFSPSSSKPVLFAFLQFASDLFRPQEGWHHRRRHWHHVSTPWQVRQQHHS